MAVWPFGEVSSMGACAGVTSGQGLYPVFWTEQVPS